MKKFLFLLLSMAVLSASAGVTKSAIQKNVAKYSNKAKTEMVSKFKVSHEVKATPVLKAPVTEQPAGEVKTYLRSGECLAVDGDYVEHLTQDGFIDLIFAENNIVWFKNIFYKVNENFGDSYVYGTLSEDGTKITVPMGQSIYWSDYYSADVVLSFGTSSVGSNIAWTPDESVSEVVYAIEGNKIVLQGCGGATPSGSDYPEYEYNGLGSVWTDDGTFGGYLEWETVFTYAIVPNVPVISVVPGATNAYVEWAADEKADGWNLRYRPWTDLSVNPYFADFDFVGEEIPDTEGFWVYDADGDGYGWGLAYSSSAQDDACLYSYSWSSQSGALTPDNYIGTPDVPLKGVLRFTVWGTSDSWPDTYMVYAMVGDDMYPLFDEDQQTTAAHRDVEIDLSQFNGESGSIVFRHYNCNNQYAIYIDDIFIGDPNAEIIEPAPWTYAYEITDPNYTIEGLTPETKYEVQVMGYNTEFESQWCDIVEFTTLPEAPAVPDLYILGEVNDQTWAANAGLKMDYNAEDNLYTATVTFDGRGESGENYFSFTTELAEDNDDGGWAYIAPFRYGAVTEGGEDFWYDDMYDGQPLDIAPGQTAFRIMGGEYKITVDLNGLKVIIERVGAQVMPGDVNNDGLININDVTTLIDHQLNSDFEDADDFSRANADVDGDGEINVGDLAALIDMLLN